MRKLQYFLFVTVILGLVSACQSETKQHESLKEENKDEVVQNDNLDQDENTHLVDETIDENTPEGSGVLYASIDTFPFNELVEEADLIASVKINEKIGEINEPIPKSIFSLNIEKVYKGGAEKENTATTVYQIGNDEWVFEENKYTFHPDEEYILFLKETVEVDDSEYFLLSEHAGLFKQIDEETLVKLAYDDVTLESTESESTDVEVFSDISLSDFDEDETQTFEKTAFINKLDEEITD